MISYAVKPVCRGRARIGDGAALTGLTRVNFPMVSFMTPRRNHNHGRRGPD